MKVLFVLENYYPNIGGVETLFKTLAEALVLQGHEITVLTNKFNADLLSEELINGVHIKRYNFHNRYLFTLFAVWPIFKTAKQVDLIHTTSYNAGLPSIIAGKLRGKKVLITFHEVWSKLWFRLPYFSKLSQFLHYSFEQFLVKLPFDKFIAVSQNTAKALFKSGIKNGKIELIYNGINYDEWTSNNERIKSQAALNFIYFGRLGISKGTNLLVPAYEKVRREFPNSTLTIVVPKEPRNLLKIIQDQISQVSFEFAPKIIHSLPFEELKATIQAHDVVLIPSYSEGFGYTAVESVALDMPIISSGQASLKETVSGKYIEMKEQTAEGLANAMIKACKNDWTFSDKKYFELSTTVSNYVRMYEQFIKEKIA